MSTAVSNGSSTSKAFVLLDTVPSALALPAVSVLEIVHATDWQAQPPTSFSHLLPISFSALEPMWVLSLAGAGRSVAVSVSGTIRMNYLSPLSLLPLTLNYGGFSNFSHLVSANGEPLALVVNMNVLFERIAS